MLFSCVSAFSSILVDRLELWRENEAWLATQEGRPAGSTPAWELYPEWLDPEPWSAPAEWFGPKPDGSDGCTYFHFDALVNACTAPEYFSYYCAELNWSPTEDWRKPAADFKRL